MYTDLIKNKSLTIGIFKPAIFEFLVVFRSYLVYAKVQRLSRDYVIIIGLNRLQFNIVYLV